LRGTNHRGHADAHRHSVIGIVAATVASFFFEQERDPAPAQMVARLDTIKRKLYALLHHDPRES
jgi:hypothetical protein